MSGVADFWAGYVSGAIGILVGNPLDLIKTRLQAGTVQTSSVQPTRSNPVIHLPWSQQFEHWSTLTRGAAAPILGYGALNALLFVTYNRSLALLSTGAINDWPKQPSATNIWAAGALGGLAIFFVSAPTELVKCRAQVSNPPRSSWEVTRDLWKAGRVRGLYLGGGITSIRDSVGYGF
jgi:solute carrier family 25 (mitochondrial carnitine/acylcarnitine transporter), member 20/29